MDARAAVGHSGFVSACLTVHERSSVSELSRRWHVAVEHDRSYSGPLRERKQATVQPHSSHRNVQHQRARYSALSPSPDRSSANHQAS